MWSGSCPWSQWEAPTPGTLIFLPGLHFVLEPPPQGSRLPKLGRHSQEVPQEGCVWNARQGRAGQPVGWVTEGAALGLVLVSRTGLYYSAQSSQELAVAEIIKAYSWHRCQGSLPLEG